MFDELDVFYKLSSLSDRYLLVLSEGFLLSVIADARFGGLALETQRTITLVQQQKTIEQLQSANKKLKLQIRRLADVAI